MLRERLVDTNKYLKCQPSPNLNRKWVFWISALLILRTQRPNLYCCDDALPTVAPSCHFSNTPGQLHEKACSTIPSCTSKS